MAEPAAAPPPAASRGAVPASAAPPASTPPLDDVMLAMDVVDTLRHADQLVERELSSEERDRQLKQRLRQIYAAQGIAVSDAALDEGVKALHEERFAYQPAGESFGRRMAMLWIHRRRWLRGVAVAVALAAVGIGGYAVYAVQQQRAATEQQQALNVTLPKALQDEVERIRAIAKDPAAVATAQTLQAEGTAAVQAGDAKAARAKVSDLQSLRQQLEQSYIIRIVSRPGQPSGAFRIPDANPNARNYYLIVEAVDNAGQPVAVPITSEETGRTERVATWGLRVSQATFNRVRADKEDDGIIQNNRVGEKRKGFLEPEYTVPVQGGAILSW
jgi:anti-sigma-K factor RskA